MPEVRKLQVVGKFGEGTVKSVNGVLPDDIGNVELKMETVDEEETLAMMLELGALPAVIDSDGAILTDENGAILLI